MIENERQLQAARESIEYWKSTMTTGGSWLGNEDARAEIMQIQKEIAAYERRRAQEQQTKDAADVAAKDASSTV
jgi:hypothetical protein